MSVSQYSQARKPGSAGLRVLFVAVGLLIAGTASAAASTQSTTRQLEEGQPLGLLTLGKSISAIALSSYSSDIPASHRLDRFNLVTENDHDASAIIHAATIGQRFPKGTIEIFSHGMQSSSLSFYLTDVIIEAVSRTTVTSQINLTLDAHTVTIG